jgi:tetratricopeptide (TPR) repeat protein
MSLVFLFAALLCENAELSTRGLPSSLDIDSLVTAAAATSIPPQAPASPPSAERLAANELLSEAQGFYRRGDFYHAMQTYQQVLQESPKSADAYAGLTRVYLKKKDVKQADATITAGLRIADSPTLHVALGEVYFRQGKISEAEDQWIKVINSGHQDARAYWGLARVRWALSMYKSGWGLIEKAHQLDPTDPEIRSRWMGRLSRAERIKYLEEYLAGENNDDAETRADMQHYLEYLKARAGDPRSACRLVSQATTTETKLVRLMVDPTHLRGYGLSVVVNGKNSKLLLDTGASGLMINRNLAQRAGVTRLSETDIGGIGDRGNRNGYIGLANHFKIGELEFQDCPVQVLEQRSVTGEEGLIGADVLAAFLIDIDFPNERLRLGELPKPPEETATKITLQTEKDDSNPPGQEPTENTAQQKTPAKNTASPQSGPQDRYIAPEMKSYTMVYRFGHNLLVPTLVGDAPVKLFLLDTGSTTNLISTSAAGEVTEVHGDPRTIVRGLSGSVKNVYRADEAVIQFGHLRQRNQGLVAFDLTHLSDRIGTEASGVLGFTTLRLLDIKIDYRDGLVDFSYDSKHWEH